MCARGLEALRNLDVTVAFDHALDRDDGVGAVRAPHRRWRSPPPCPARAAPADGSPGRDAGGDRQLAGSVRRTDGEPVHRRAWERRQIRSRERRLGEHAAGRIRSGTGSSRKRLRSLEDARERVVDREQFARRRESRVTDSSS